MEESYLTTIDINGKALQVEILDTAGQAEYTPLRETFMHTGDGFLLIYSITDDQTLEDLREIREQILRVHPRPDVCKCFSESWSLMSAYVYLGMSVQVPMVVVGNKLDRQSSHRAVSAEEGAALAEEFGASFLEVSVSVLTPPPSSHS